MCFFIHTTYIHTKLASRTIIKESLEEIFTTIASFDALELSKIHKQESVFRMKRVFELRQNLTIFVVVSAIAFVAVIILVVSYLPFLALFIVRFTFFFVDGLNFPRQMESPIFKFNLYFRT